MNAEKGVDDSVGVENREGDPLFASLFFSLRY
jgi:hypothetical protein